MSLLSSSSLLTSSISVEPEIDAGPKDSCGEVIEPLDVGLLRDASGLRRGLRLSAEAGDEQAHHAVEHCNEDDASLNM